ncbi:hypothetical protein NA57DRAFT_71840 [Rhizodiscina lignyota]|uniref:Pru domain-containing protein n=1 Tax=Rhizodiscina lignyota TaxID=1504668 RepID=A0A9P4IP74_9PEZI|nr:hypothetical protein NA57DRAFT_71840 [Rhizodiscina lignyota]
MSIQPIITFKAGKCNLDNTVTPWKITADSTPGYLYFWQEDELMHFCWRPRSASVRDPDIELFMIAGDASFLPYTGKDKLVPGENPLSPTNGRICVLKFHSSGERYLFWLQSKSQHPEGKPNWFSQRDLRMVKIIDLLLSGQEVNPADIEGEITFDQSRRDDDDGGDQDEPMGDADPPGDRSNSTGGAGADAAGGDFREEGEEAREGGADGARAASAGTTDASAIVQNFLNSLKGRNIASSSQQEKLFTTLGDLLSSENTVPIIQKADISFLDGLLSHLPPTILLLAQEVDDATEVEPNAETVQAAIEALSVEQKKDILLRVLRSPQLHQSLGSLTVALRDGGLPSVSEALKIPVENGGFVRHGAVPLGGGDAVEAFLNGVKKAVDEEKGDEKMDTS